MSGTPWPLTEQIKLYNKWAKKSSFTKHDYSTLIALMCFVCHGGVQIKEQRLLQSHTIVHQLASQKLCLLQINRIHLALEYDCLNVWNFVTQFPCRLFGGAIKWSHSQGNHVVLAETSMIRLNVLHIKRIIHISTNTDNGGKSIVCVCVCVYSLRVCVCVLWSKINTWRKKKKKKAQTVVFSNPVCPPPCSQDSSSLHHTTGCFCTITRLLLTYMEMPCENKKLPFPSCPLYAPVCARACVCTCTPECVLCMRARCVHSKSVFRGNCSLWCSPMQASADTPISLHGADASYASASPQKPVYFNAKWSKIGISYIQAQPEDVSTKRQNHTLYLGR